MSFDYVPITKDLLIAFKEPIKDLMRPNRNKKPQEISDAEKKRLDDIEKAKVNEFNNQLNKWEHGKTTLEKQMKSFEAKVKHNQATIDLKVEAMMDGKVKDV